MTMQAEKTARACYYVQIRFAPFLAAAAAEIIVGLNNLHMDFRTTQEFLER